MRRIRAAVLLAALSSLCFASFASLGCQEREGPMERAGEELDEAGEEIEDEIDDAG
jgi:hypothetical protein